LGVGSELIKSGYNIKQVGKICHHSEGFSHAQGLDVWTAGQIEKSLNQFHK